MEVYVQADGSLGVHPPDEQGEVQQGEVQRTNASQRSAKPNDTTGDARTSQGEVQRTKRCYKCRQVKPLDAFAINRADRSGRQSYCRDCCKLIAPTYRQAEKRKMARNDQREAALIAQWLELMGQ